MRLYAPNAEDAPFGPTRPGVALSQAGRRRRVARQPPGQAGAGQLPQPARRPAPPPDVQPSTPGRRPTSSGPTTTPAMPSRPTAGSCSCQRQLRQPEQPAWPVNTTVQPTRPLPPRTGPSDDPVAGPPALTPALAHRDRKINLNYPLPVSNDPNEPIRQKWIRDTYQMLKAVLPPLAVDTPEELAQLSQFVVNIIDFRDPDGTMTRFENTDLVIKHPTSTPDATRSGRRHRPWRRRRSPTRRRGRRPRPPPISWSSTAWNTTRWRSMRSWRISSTARWGRHRRPLRRPSDCSSSWSTP